MTRRLRPCVTCARTYFQFHLAPLHFNCTGLLPVLFWPPLSFEPEDHVTNYLLDISPLKSLINTTNCICILTSLLRPQIGVTLKSSSPLVYTTQNSSVQGIFPTQESNSGLLHRRQILYHLSCKGSITPLLCISVTDRILSIWNSE